MSRRKSKMTVGAKYAAIGALSELLAEMGANTDLAEMLVEKAWDVDHQPVAGKVCVIFDLARLDQPAEPEADTPHP